MSNVYACDINFCWLKSSVGDSLKSVSSCRKCHSMFMRREFLEGFWPKADQEDIVNIWHGKHLALYAFLLYLKMCILPLYSVYCIEGYKSERKQVWVHWVWAPVYPLPVIYHAWLAGRTLKYQITWWVNLKTYSVEGFHVMSYASFASHYAQNCHVVFLFPWHGIGKHNKMCCYFLCSTYHHITTEWQEYQHTHSVEIF